MKWTIDSRYFRQNVLATQELGYCYLKIFYRLYSFAVTYHTNCFLHVLRQNKFPFLMHRLNAALFLVRLSILQLPLQRLFHATTTFCILYHHVGQICNFRLNKLRLYRAWFSNKSFGITAWQYEWKYGKIRSNKPHVFSISVYSPYI